MKPALDFSSCEKTKANIFKIQSFGAVVKTTLVGKILSVSNNAEYYFGIKPEDMIGKFIKDDFSNLSKELRENSPERTDKPFVISIQDKEFTVTRKVFADHKLYEFEERNKFEGNTDLNLSEYINSLRTYFSLNSLLGKVVEDFQALSDFDRVVVYKFQEKWNGEVIAECKKSSIPSLLGIHFPATDIPEQARNAYLTNKQRLIPDIYADEVGFTPSDPQIDFRNSYFRIVAPHHKVYMQNMGTGASFVLSIVIDSKLWGLIIFHNILPKYMNPEMRNFFRTVADILELQISVLQEKETLTEFLELTKIKEDLSKEIQKIPDENILDDLNLLGVKFMSLMSSEGVLIKISNRLISLGATPSFEDLNELESHIFSNPQKTFQSSNSIIEILPNWKTKNLCGFFFIPLDSEKRNYIIWFREERVKHLEWSGDPEAPALPTDEGVSPRKSFERWKFIVRNESIAWSTNLEKLVPEISNLGILFNNKLLSAELSRSNLKLKESNSSKDKFFSILSHNIRSPIASVLGLSEMLLKSDFDEADAKEFLQNIHMSAAQANLLVGHLLHWGRILTGKIVPSPKTFLTEDFSLKLMTQFSNKLKSKNLSIDFEMESREIFFDESILYSILELLIDNAIKYSTLESRRISIHETKSGQKHTITVRDFGIGISELDLPKLFKLESKFKTKGTAGEDGAGLSLIIVKEYLTLLEGHIRVESVLGKGSKVILEIS